DRSIGKVWSDPVRLQQVILNLLTNAIKFTPDKGTVEVRLERKNDEEVVRLQVIDTGIGIHADFLPRVFDRFRQADSSTTRSFGGLGLGLAIVRHLVELMGGTIRAESPGEGKGSAFTIVLPLWQGGDPLLNQAVSEDLEGARVL
ncbi:MAG: hybrid sensor histidine kinase/response regulator, partial [Phormidesmis sp. CAN_BIN44]|nr:hybrid sensor histidine kinase/response regulator [Phormidesmis sp. CAN_BIN44]